jgi:uronate dehydrogenase
LAETETGRLTRFYAKIHPEGEKPGPSVLISSNHVKKFSTLPAGGTHRVLCSQEMGCSSSVFSSRSQRSGEGRHTIDMQQRVLITGAAGRLGGILIRGLERSYPLSLMDRRALPRGSEFPFRLLDLSQPEIPSEYFTDIGTIVHLAGEPTAESPWERLFSSNVMATQNLLQAAHQAGCRRVILASSVQVMDGYPPGTDITPDLPIWPVNPYAVSKGCAEAVAERLSQRTRLRILVLRLGWVLPRHHWLVTPKSPFLDRVITEEDFVRALQAALAWQDPPPFAIHHVLSDNRVKRLNIESARSAMDFRPEDDSYRIASRNIRGMAQWMGMRVRHHARNFFRQVFFREPDAHEPG